MRSLTQDCTLDTQLIWTHALFFCGLSMSGHSLLWNHIGHRLWIEGGFLCESQEVVCFQSILSTGHILSNPGVQPFKTSISIFLFRKKEEEFLPAYASPYHKRFWKAVALSNLVPHLLMYLDIQIQFNIRFHKLTRLQNWDIVAVALKISHFVDPQMLLQ